MKKIVFMSMIMQELQPAYKLSEKSKSSYKGLVGFPITVTLADDLCKDDDVLVCILKMADTDSEKYEINEKKLKDELNTINESIGAHIEYKRIESDFIEARDAFKKRFMEMFDSLEEGAKMYADVTYGTKPTSMLIMNVLYFAEKFYDADIETIVYGKTEFDKQHHPIIEKSKVCDVTILYLLNNLTANISANSGEEAKEILNMFFGN